MYLYMQSLYVSWINDNNNDNNKWLLTGFERCSGKWFVQELL